MAGAILWARVISGAGPEINEASFRTAGLQARSWVVRREDYERAWRPRSGKIFAMSLVLHGYHYSVYNRIARLALAEKGVAYDRSR